MGRRAIYLGRIQIPLTSVVHTGFWQDPPTFRLSDIDERIERYRDVRFFKNMTPVRVLSRLQIYGGGFIPAVSYGSENIVYCGHYVDRWTPSHSYLIISRLLELAHVELSPMGSTLLDEELKRRKNTTWEFLFQRNTFFYSQNGWDEMDKPRLTMLLSLAFPELAERVKFTLSLESTPLPSFITGISNEQMGETVGAESEMAGATEE